MGLYVNIPESHMSDMGEREHWNRIWWTAYTLDRMWAIKLGHPFVIRDDEIGVNLPSNPVGLGDGGASDFPDRGYFVARIGLARLSGRIIYSIYDQKEHTPFLSHQVQAAFGDLRRWLEDLPSPLQIDGRNGDQLDPRARSPPFIQPGASLLLAFNLLLLFLLDPKLVILATRPILLHVLRVHLEARKKQPWVEANVPASAAALSETCVRCARHSCHLLVYSWTNGTFIIFDFFYTQYLFSPATVLGISTLLDNSKER